MIYKFERQQLVKKNISEVWKFFSDPHKLELITPPDLNLRVTNNIPEKIYQGLIISYLVTPFPLVSNTWLTEITTVKENEFFIDEQRFGPYKFWHHQHIFLETLEGVLVKDLIHYQLPLSLIASPIHKLLVRPKLEYIFDYRAKQIDEIFNKA